MEERKMTSARAIFIVGAVMLCLAVISMVAGCVGAANGTNVQSTRGSTVSAVAETSSGVSSATGEAKTSATASSSDSGQSKVTEDGIYTGKDEVAAYIHEFGHLPDNFISKTKAKKAGWDSSKGNLDEVCPGMSIGGSKFYNDDGKLPDEQGRTWTECDINYTGGYRGAERIVFSNDGLIYYTADHYETFEQLY